MKRFLLMALLWWLVIEPASALEVRQVIWGFDGHVVPGRMMPLSLLIGNPSRENFDGEVTVRETMGMGGGVGAPYVEPVFLSAGAERWVQFHVFTTNGGVEFSVAWGRGGKDHTELEPNVAGPPARVLLTDPGNPFATAGGLKIFSDSVFPTSVAATDGLDAVALDYVPRWEAARRGAFLDWVKRGGIVMLLHGGNGEYPVFEGPLEVLNTEGDSARIGSGTVLREPVSRREVTAERFVSRGFAAPVVKDGKQPNIYNFEQSIFQQLAGLTRPNIRWWIINLLTLLYVAVIGPVHYFVGKRMNYCASIGMFLAGVAFFGWAFAAVGKRGYNEQQTVHSASIARSLGGGRYDVTQWISAFATSGATYEMTHAAPVNLYAAVSAEGVNGRIFNGKDGAFAVDIPLYSSRQFVHRAVMPGPDFALTVEHWQESGGGLDQLRIKTGSAFPATTGKLLVRFGDLFYPLKRSGDLLELDGGRRSGETFSAAVPLQDVQGAQNLVMEVSDAPLAQVESRVRERLQGMLPLLQVRALDGRDYASQSIDRQPLPPDRVALYFFAEAPPAFHLQSRGFQKELGYVLYVQELMKP